MPPRQPPGTVSQAQRGPCGQATRQAGDEAGDNCMADRGRRIGEGEGEKMVAVSIDVFVGGGHGVVPK